MESRIKNIIIIILILVSSFLVGYIFILGKTNPPPEVTYVVHTDTLVIRDSVIREHTITKYITRDSILYVHVKDSSIDTILVPIEIAHKIYHDTIENDSSTYDITICHSGYLSEINKIDIISSHTNQVLKQTAKPRKFHISLLAGYYTGYNLIDKLLYSGPGVGIGISYDIW